MAAGNLNLGKASGGVLNVQPADGTTTTSLVLPAINGTVVAADANGNVGIGIAPVNGEKLQVKTGTNRNLGVSDQTTITGAVTIEGIDDTRGSNIPLEIRGSTVSITRPTGTTAVFDSSGNVGIGTSSPSYALDVKSSKAGEQTLRVQNDNTADGSQAQIRVIGNNNTSEIDLRSWSINSTGTRAGIAKAGLKEVCDNSTLSDTNGLLIVTDQAKPIYFATTGTERMRIDSAGRVTMPYQPAFIAVGISGDVATDAPLVFVTNHASVPSQRSSGYSTSTGAFTAPVSGFYQFNFTAYDFNTGSISAYEVRKNGGYYNVAGDHFQIQEATDATMTTWSFNIYLQVNDYIQMGKRAGTLNLYSGHTMWSGYLIG